MKTARAAVVLLTLIAAVFACGDATGPAPYSVLLRSLPPWLERGDTFRLEAVAVHNTDTVPGARIDWLSSDPSVATVDSSGLVTGRSPGFTTITVGTPTSSVSFELLVVERFVALRLTPDNSTIVPDDRTWLTATPIDSSGTPVFGSQSGRFDPAAVHWTIADPTILQLDALYPGLLTAGNEGATQVTATFAGRSGTVTVTVAAVKFTQVVTGTSYSCGLTDRGRSYCWGAIAGQGSAIYEWWHPAHVPREMLPRTPLVTLTGGSEHACGLNSAGEAYCWGNNIWGQLGASGWLQGVSLVPGGHHFSTIVAGGGHTCALAIDGTLYCWGKNGSGQVGVDSGMVCGTGGKYSIVSVCRPPTVVPGAIAFVTLSAGQEHTCGSLANGQVYCWGQFGAVRRSAPSAVSSPQALAATASGVHYSCGLTAAGAAYCWGENYFGLGDGATTLSAAAIPVAGGLAFRQLSADPGASFIPGAGSAGTCGVTTADAVYCWGGQGEFADSVPAPVDGGVTFATVAPGSGHLCGVARDGLVYCWGYNAVGSAGVPEDEYLAAPRRVVGQH